MLSFVVVFIVPFLMVRGMELEHTSGLHFDVNQEYAPSYEDYKPRDYKFEYGVLDPYTGDHKSHWELRENGVVRGEYRLLEPDGTTRIVQYTADDHNGFRAVVKKIGKAVHPLSGHDSTNSYSSTIPQDASTNYEGQPYYKAYDGSGENYANGLPTPSYYPNTNNLRVINNFLPQTESPNTFGNLLDNVESNRGLLGVENLKTLQQESQNIPEVIPSHQYIHSQVPSDEMIKDKALISSYIGKPSYISENIDLDSQGEVPASFPMRQEVYAPSGSMSLNNEYLPLAIQTKSDAGYSQINYAQEQHSQIMQPLSIGIKIDHPHGESSSSFYGRTGNIEDDAAYKSHDSTETVSNW
ncbi:uncharacterized protein LOC123315808 [Coccinella septempunctata]|uniref:uncharacterized protein LOC123315808 n=1 Tax=Coccinella septempunctata TaxID=41139 RepID=UPI001D08990A|nr:uncharacterized protein LOC123315808 [Coccinella septempunctata]